MRGLSSEASVEFRGIRVGSVVGASFKYFPGDLEHRVPVLIKIDPNLLLDQAGSNTNTAQELIAKNVEKGLRASLKSGSLLTGSFSWISIFKNTQLRPPWRTWAAMKCYQPYQRPGWTNCKEKVAALLDKFKTFKTLPVEKTVSNANDALAAVKEAATNLDKLTGPDSLLNKTLNHDSRRCRVSGYIGRFLSQILRRCQQI